MAEQDLTDLLGNLDDDPRRRGRQFEAICRWYLLNDPVYRAQLREVWLWDYWTGRWGADAGIDLVAETHDGHLWAIQAKAYDPGPSARVLDVDPADFRKREWRRILKRAQLPHRPIKDLRDTFASQLLTAGAQLGYISRQLGHSDVSVTARHYARWAGGCPPCSSNNGKRGRGKRPDVQAESRTQRLVAVPWACQAYRSPWQHPFAERGVGTCRLELLDHVVVLGEQHVRRLLEEYVDYYNVERVHTALEDSLDGGPDERRPSPSATVVGLPRVGGLHHRYAWRNAA